MSSSGDDYNPLSTQHRMELPYGQELEVHLNGAARRNHTYRLLSLNEDDTVRACCLHAHDVARAHGAREVMLEHLVHALARVGNAVSVLADRGINVDALRRESATVISSEIPVDHTSQAPLKPSRDFNTVMYLAAASASRKDDKPTGVRDVLDALYSFDPKSRAVRLIKRHTPGVDPDERIDPLADLRDTLNRYADEVRELRLNVADLRNSQHNQYTGSHEALQDRMHKLESLVASLVSEVRNDRVATGDRLQSIQRALGAGAGSQLQTMLGDRFLSMQKAIDVQRGDLQRMEQAVGERLKSLEQTIELAMTSGGPGDSHGVVDRLKAVEQSLEVQLGEVARLESKLVERLQSFERLIEAQGGGFTRNWTNLGERLGALERGLAANKSDMQRMLESIATGQTGGLQGALGLDERFASLQQALEQQLAGFGRSANALQERIGVLERSLEGQRKDMTTVTEAIDEELESLRRALKALGDAQITLSGAIEEWRADHIGNWSVIQNYLKSLPTAPQPPAAPQSNGHGTGPAAIAATLRPAQGDQQARETVAATSPPSMLEKVVDRALKSRLPNAFD